MDDLDERRASVLHAMYDGVAPGTIGREYGKQRPAAARIANITMGLKIKSALRNFLNQVRFEEIIDFEEGSDAAFDDQAVSSSSDSPSGHQLAHRSSIVQSMNEYMFRRRDVEDKVSLGLGVNIASISFIDTILMEFVAISYSHCQIKAGIVFDINESEDVDVPVEFQANLEMYDDEHQRMRSEIKVHLEFGMIDLAVFLTFACVHFSFPRPHSVRRHSRKKCGEFGPSLRLRISCLEINFSTSSRKVHSFCCRRRVLQTATEDWAKDLEKARELKMTNEAGDELSFDAFYKAIYELVDTWCETAELAEYMDMIRRLIDGVTKLDSSGIMLWRSDSDIVHDRHFSMAGFENALGGEDGEDAQDVDQESIFDEDKKPGILPPYVSKQIKKKEFVLPVEKINKVIAALFQAKQKSDRWAIKREYGSFIRFDRFVLRYFLLQVGMMGIARRHLRLFVRSAVKHLRTSPNGCEELPRIYLFCCLTGLESPMPNGEFNPRLSAEYFQPALRSLFPNPMVIEGTFLARNSEQDPPIPEVVFKDLEVACIPLSLQAMVGGKTRLSTIGAISARIRLKICAISILD